MQNPFSTVALEPTYDAQPGPNVPLQGGSATGVMPPMKKTTMLFHALFKVLALAVYIFASWIFGDKGYVMTFVVVTILSAMDFWTVKNVSGRLLVGLRWWNDVDEAGQNHWRFESFEARGRPPPPVNRGRGCASSPCYACVCVPLSGAGAAIHPPVRQQLLLGGALRSAHRLGDTRIHRPHHLQGHVGPAHRCARRRPWWQLAPPEHPLPPP